MALPVPLVLALQVFPPLLLMFAVSAPVAVLLAPLNRRPAKALGGRETLAAGFLVVVTTIVILVLVVILPHVLARQALVFFDWVRPRLPPAELGSRTLVGFLSILRGVLAYGVAGFLVAPVLSLVLSRIRI